MKTVLLRSSLAFFLLIALLANVQAQDPQYSQFYSNLTLLNPAFTGSGTGPRVALNSRAQWVGIPGYYKQFAVAYDQPVYFLGTTQGLGVTVAGDVAGEGNLARYDVNLNYAYQVDISDDHTLRFGLAGGIQQASLDFYALRFPDQIDARDGFVRPTQEPANISQASLRADVSAGVAYYNEYAWLGVTVNHITEPLQTFTDFDGAEAKLPRKYTVTGGINIPIQPMGSRREMSITPAFLYKMQGEFVQIDAGLYVNVEPMVFGVWYRNQDALIGLIGVKHGPFSFGYSYDYTVSSLTQNISGGAHELSLVLEFEQYRRPRGMKHRKMPCPKF
jgi:type IX secretion system PorP/SprF family membrane protein